MDQHERDYWLIRVILVYAAGHGWTRAWALISRIQGRRPKIEALESQVAELEAELQAERGRSAQLHAAGRTLQTLTVESLRLCRKSWGAGPEHEALVGRMVAPDKVLEALDDGA